MLYAAPVLNEIVPCQQIFGIIIADAFKRTILAFFRIEAVHYRHSYLHIGIIHIILTQYEVTFQFSDPADTDIITF